MVESTKPAVPKKLKKWREEGQILELQGKKIFVHDQGPKVEDAVFIVHGYPGSSWDFQGVVERIGDQARTVVMDMRGFGLSEKPLEGTYQETYTLALQADLYEALAEKLGLKSVILVAHDMGQTVGLELMARFEESRTVFRIRHAILLDGSTLVDMIQLQPFQAQLLKEPAVASDDDMSWQDIVDLFPGTFGKETKARDDFDEIVTCMSHQIDHDHGSRVMGSIGHYLKERKEEFGRWSRTLFTFKHAPMTVIWGVQDPVAVIAMADRIKKERPVTDLYKYEDTGHWPSIEWPDRIGDAIIARLGS
ncbi:MAG: alpha/beta hydrolase, partial [Chloroflexi bacterium]|nr:alpha/beta hydrolase [Chloroflexota bacterium]